MMDGASKLQPLSEMNDKLHADMDAAKSALDMTRLAIETGDVEIALHGVSVMAEIVKRVIRNHGYYPGVTGKGNPEP